MEDMNKKDNFMRGISLQKSSEIKISPITNLPLMNNSVEIRKASMVLKTKPTAIVRPTRIVYISHRNYTGQELRLINLCFLCSAGNPCNMCCCRERQETPPTVYQSQDEFVSAQKADMHHSLVEIEQDNKKKPFLLCKECMCSRDWPIVTVENSFLIVKFLSVKLSLSFFQSHSHFLSLSWGYEMQTVTYKPEERNIRINILEKVFAENKRESTGFHVTIEDPIKKKIKPALVSILETEKSRDFICMASGRISNIALQAKIKDLSQNDLFLTISKLSSHVFFYLSKHKYGTYVIQLIISMVKDEMLVEEIKRHISIYSTPMLQHEIGNYVVQRVIEVDKRFVFDCFMKDFKGILSTRIGSRAFKNCVKHFSPYKKDILSAISLDFQTSLPTDEQKILKAALKELFFVSEKRA